MSLHAALAAFLWLGTGSPGNAQTAPTAEATIAEEQLLGAADEEDRAQALLPFTRAHSASGTVAGSLAESTAAVGVPPAAMLEALRALDGAPGPRQPQDGNAFFVRWEQTYSIEDRPIGVGRVLWAELRTADGSTVAIHRFRPREGGEQFFRTSGEAATPPAIALPLDEVNVTSRFGRRSDPLARFSAFGPVAGEAMGGPLPNPRAARQAAAAARRKNRFFSGFAPRILMHEGVDLAVPRGTPVYAASEGVVVGARPNGGYGNWVRVDHADGVATAYGHLSRFAPRIKPGVRVARGELLGFSGNTGRSTGPHLHFEVIADGQPVDPLTHAGMAQLAGTDLERFAKQVAAEERERESESVTTD
ncbi:M23 family metallopeptidase [Reyranella sp.]|uniref:M23 family metallopeptidase n=1 Tax=Reyranella sp. TaxID=1929291 RepID=UPI003D0E679E